MRWILGSEENEDDLEWIGKDKKIGITKCSTGDIVTSWAFFLSLFTACCHPQCRVWERLYYLADYSTSPRVTLGGCPRFELSGNSGWLLLILILFSIVGFNSFDLDDDCCITLSEGLAFCCDRTGDVTRGKSQCHRNRCSNSQCKVLDCLDKALFLCVS